MTDTPPEIEQMVRKMIMERSNEERFMMGVSMFEAAREMILASIPSDLPKADRRVRFFQRVYADSPLAKDEKVLAAIRGYRNPEMSVD
jgi:hypothetical protein